MSAILPGLQAFSSAFNRIAMKKLLYILAGLGLAACTSDIEELPEVGPQPGREVALTGISGTASRTQFVPGDGTEIQFQWSTGDRIWAGGVQSAEAGTDGNVADFGFTNLPGDAPYRIYYNMTGTDAEAVVPTEQRQAEPGKLQLGPNGEVVSETNLPEQIELRTGTASPTVQMCASFTQPHLYFIGKQDFSAYEAMRYNYETGKVNWDYITADLDADHSGGDIIYGYMGVHPTTEQLWVGKSTYTQSAVHVYDVSRSDALEFSSFYQKKASPAGVDFAYRFSDEWINK